MIILGGVSQRLGTIVVVPGQKDAILTKHGDPMIMGSGKTVDGCIAGCIQHVNKAISLRTVITSILNEFDKVDNSKGGKK